MKTYGLELVRSDPSDGCWSLHDPSAEDDNGIAPALISGVASTDIEDDWDRPDQDDYELARQVRDIRREARQSRH